MHIPKIDENEYWQYMISILLEEMDEDFYNEVILMPFEFQKAYVYTDLIKKSHENNKDALKLINSNLIKDYISKRIN